MHEEVGESIDNGSDTVYIEKLEEEVSPTKLTAEYREAVDIFPALHKYQTDHSLLNFKKLCVEIKDFCEAVYSSTRNAEERAVFENMLNKLHQH